MCHDVQMVPKPIDTLDDVPDRLLPTIERGCDGDHHWWSWSVFCMRCRHRIADEHAASYKEAVAAVLETVRKFEGVKEDN